jgi:hypothetical protein
MAFIVLPKVQQALKVPDISKNTVILDTGLSLSIFNHLKWFTKVYPLLVPVTFRLTIGTSCAYYSGKVELLIPFSDGNLVRFVIKDVVYSPDLLANLVGRDILINARVSWDFDTNFLYSKGDKWKYNVECSTFKGVPTIPA